MGDDRCQVWLGGEVAVVTGAGRGLGRAHALELARRGASVLCNDIDGEAAESTVATISAEGGTAAAHVGSVETPEGGRLVIDDALAAFGSVEILVNNAGQLRNAAFEEMTVGDFDDVVRTHLAGSFYVTQPAYRAMISAGYGRIVFTSSVAGAFGSPWQANYAAAKAGLVGLCNVVALEGAEHGIAANVLMPMAITGIGTGGPPPYSPEVLKETVEALRPLRATATVENVAPVVAYLASRVCEYNGQMFSVGAGNVARVFTGIAPGWSLPDGAGLTAEHVADHLDQVRDLSGYAVPGSMNEATRFIGANVHTPG